MEHGLKKQGNAAIAMATQSQTANFSQRPMAPRKPGLSQFGGVHGSRPGEGGPMNWRNRPLFRRDGDIRFKTGTEASKLLIEEAVRRDPKQTDFLQTFGNTMQSLSPVFDRNPKYAWVAKQLIEPDRLIQFRVPWLDDSGNIRQNRGFRVQYSNALGPYNGGLTFGSHVNTDYITSLAFDTLISNSLYGNVGSAFGGSDFNVRNKSESEIQRFCQSYMTELAKYIGDDIDLPGMGAGVNPQEIGYLYGQYKRINTHASRRGKGLLWGGLLEGKLCRAYGFGVVHFANKMLTEKGDSLQGKRCIITGSGNIAMAVAEKLIHFGAIPITLSDSSGHIYEDEGIDASKLSIIKQIKAERGARIGRYIMASTTAKYSDPENILEIPCDLLFPCCVGSNKIDADDVNMLADAGCMGVIEAGNMPSTPEACTIYKKRGMLYGPYKATMAAGSIVNGTEMEVNPIDSTDELDERLGESVDAVYDKITKTATEFNARGDLVAGTNIASFLKVANVMMAHGAV